MSSKKSFAKKLMKLMSFLFSGFFIAVLFWQYSQSRAVSLEYLDQQGTKHAFSLTVKDHKRLTELMQKLFAETNFAYTILGSKPVSWATYLNPLPLSNWGQFF